MVLHFLRDRLVLVVSETEYLTVLAPATGVLLAISCEAIYKYGQHRKRFNNKIFKLNKPRKTPVYNPIRESLNRLVIVKILYVHGKIILICSKLNRIIFLLLQKSRLDYSLWTEGIWKATEVVIICRAGRILFDVGKYLLKNKTNVLKTGINTLIWLADDKAKTLVYKLVFLGVSLTTAIMWTYVPLLRRILRVWSTITIFNLCSNIVVTDGRQMWLEHGPQVTAFGLQKPPIERIEHPIPQFKANPEELKSSRVILPGNETELRRSSPIRNKMKSTLLKDISREHGEISKNSILSEEAKIVPKEETKIVIEKPILANEKATIGANEKVTIVTNEEAPIVVNEETTIVVSEEAPMVVNEATTMVVNEATTMVVNEETPMVVNEETPMVINEETPMVINEETPMVINEETPMVINEETPIGANEETTIVPKEELVKTNSTSKTKRPIQKSRTNNLQKLNEKFNPPTDDDDDPTSSSHIDNVQDGTNSTKVKAGKVR